MVQSLGRVCVLLSVCLVGNIRVVSAEPQLPALMEQVSQVWTEEDWLQPRGSQKLGYMRRTGDAGWKTRLSALQSIVRQGDAVVDDLVSVLQSGTPPQRILAAQALSYLAPSVPLDPLLAAAKNDSDAAVRLYAVDALGMKGVNKDEVDWTELESTERNRDVLKHISYAKLRDGQPIDEATVAALRDLDANLIDSAAVGLPAPDLELIVPGGRSIRISDYHGKKSVVLVFVYGDT